MSETIKTAETTTGAIIDAVAVEKSYLQPDGTRIQVVGVTNLAIEPGKIIALLGPSGCGKSTLLRMLTGLAEPSSGVLSWHGKPLEGEMPNVAIVFQSFALFPWLTVLENVEAALEARGIAAVERRKRALCVADHPLALSPLRSSIRILDRWRHTIQAPCRILKMPDNLPEVKRLRSWDADWD